MQDEISTKIGRLLGGLFFCVNITHLKTFKYISRNLNKMDSFTISQMQQFSGIKAHTIRMWEQRYQALSPNRSEGNTRYYNNAQLRRLLNIVSLLEFESKHSVSKLCKLTDAELFQRIEDKIGSLIHEPTGFQHYVSQLISAAVEFDEVYFDKIFISCVAKLGLKETYIKVLYPLLNRIGIMWTSNNMPPAQEHFISHLIKQKLCVAIDALPPAKPEKGTWILFLPENEFHEIGLLFANYIIREAGHHVIYLGANVPADTLTLAAEQNTAFNLFCFVVHQREEKEAQLWIEELEKQFNEMRLFISGNSSLIEKLKLGKHTKWLKSVSDLEKSTATSTKE